MAQKQHPVHAPLLSLPAAALRVGARMRQGTFTQGRQYPRDIQDGTTPSDMVKKPGGSAPDEMPQVPLTSVLNEWNYRQRIQGREGPLDMDIHHIPILIANFVKFMYNPDDYAEAEEQVRLPPPAGLDTKNGELPGNRRDTSTRLMHGLTDVDEKHKGLDVARHKARVCYVVDGSNIAYYNEKKGEHFMFDRSHAMTRALTEARRQYDALDAGKKSRFPKLPNQDPDLRGNVVLVSSQDTLDYTFSGKWFDPQPDDYLTESQTDGTQIRSDMAFRELLLYGQIERIRSPNTLVGWAGIKIHNAHVQTAAQHGYDDFFCMQTVDFMKRANRYDVVVLVHDDEYRDRDRTSDATIRMFQRDDVRADTELQFYAFHESKWLLESHKDALIDGNGWPETVAERELRARRNRWQRLDQTPPAYTNRYNKGTPAASP